MSNEGDFQEHPEGSAIETVTTCVRVNGKVHTLAIDPRTSLLDLVREHLGLTGSKKGCDHGQWRHWFYAMRSKPGTVHACVEIG
jgi:aerobic-type carbon monoxide dehydrogenase small subunit (CoxS/CutS family)